VVLGDLDLLAELIFLFLKLFYAVFQLQFFYLTLLQHYSFPVFVGWVAARHFAAIW